MSYSIIHTRCPSLPMRQLLLIIAPIIPSSRSDLSEDSSSAAFRIKIMDNKHMMINSAFRIHFFHYSTKEYGNLL